ncbi:14910_t:CDS:1, partial [Funneliformis mosseae]
LGFELFLALSFAWDKPESDTGLMKLPPRKPVTATSIERIRRRALNRTPTITDPETGHSVTPSKVSQILHTMKKPFTKTWWSDLLEGSEGEVLVDAKLLRWSYLEIGVIELIGALVAYFVVLNYHGITPRDARIMQHGVTEGKYFTDNAIPYTNVHNTVIPRDVQIKALAEAQSIVYLSIMIQQMFNLFACKARFRFPFGKFIFSNPRNFLGLTFGVVLGMCVVYIPPFNIAFQTSYTLSPIFWLIPLGFGIVILIYATIKIILLRKLRPINLNPEIIGLQMHPTIRSVERKT